MTKDERNKIITENIESGYFVINKLKICSNIKCEKCKFYSRDIDSCEFDFDISITACDNFFLRDLYPECFI